MTTQNKTTTDQIELANLVTKGDVDSRIKINAIIDPIIRYQTNRFCKRHCYQNKFKFTCTLVKSSSSYHNDAVLCEWGNASYGWMLEDLTSNNRISNYKGTQGSSIKNYLYTIANSLPFYERWKDWRFGGNVHVPTYIQELHHDASHVFYSLRADDSVALIAQKLGRPENEIEDLCRRIIVILTQRKKLFLLNSPATVSMNEVSLDPDLHEESVENDVPSFDEDPVLTEDKRQLAEVWKRLSPVEQFVIEAMVIENQDAEDILNALLKLNISIKKGIAAKNTNRQQLYYFRRKTLAKLNGLMKIE